MYAKEDTSTVERDQQKESYSHEVAINVLIEYFMEKSESFYKSYHEDGASDDEDAGS